MIRRVVYTFVSSILQQEEDSGIRNSYGIRAIIWEILK